jgi:peptidoglycan/LPS O-acetylase OafA/YrhL
LPTTAHPPARISELDGLRGLAIGFVMWHHLVEFSLPPGRETWLGWLRAATNLSWCGVDLFFVLSGFFIGGILLDQRASPRLARVFYLRRALRILPLYYVTLLVTFSCAALGVAQSWHLFPPWVYALFLTNFYLAGHQAWDWLPLSVLWSLAIEEQFYLAAPWIVRALRPAVLPWLAGGLVLVALGLRVTCQGLWPGNYFAVHVLMPMRMDALALGALVAWAVRHDSNSGTWVHLARWWPQWLTLGIALLAGLALLRPVEGGRLLAAGGYTLLALVFALVVAVVAGVRPAGLNRLLAWRPLAQLGRHSYFLYLWHGLLGVGLVHWWGGEHFVLNSPSGLLIVLSAGGATWLAAALSWRFFEAPFIRWGQRHAY